MKVKMLVFCFSFLTISAYGAFRAAEAAPLIAEDGESRSVIILGKGASAPERHAAEELSYFLRRIIGADIRITDAPVRGKYGIWVGTPETSSGAARFRREVAALSDHGFVLRSDRRGLVITGKSPLGVLYGAYAFLEEYAGMRWFFPGEEGTYWPDSPTLEAGNINEVQNPAFEERTVAFGGSATTARTVDSWDWIVRNRMHFNSSKHVYRMHREEFEKRGAGTQMGGHVLMRFVPDELIEEHPEYFALIDGERVTQTANGRHRSQPCTTHSDVIDRIADGVLGMLREEPEGGIYRFLNNDTGGWCECEDCRAVDPPVEINRSGGSVSTRFYTLKNEVARRLWGVMPEADIWGYAYQAYRLPPAGVMPHERLGVMLCDHGRCFRHSLDDPACDGNRFFREMYGEWAEWPNRKSNFTYYNAGLTAPGAIVINRPAERVVADDLRYMRGLGFTNWNMRTVPPDGVFTHLELAGRETVRQRYFWRANLHMMYIQAKLAWNPELDFEEIFDDINEKFYGPAAEPMGKFRREILRLWEETPGHFMYGADWTLYGRSLVSPGAADRLLSLLDLAEEAAAGKDEYLEKIADDRMIFESTWLPAYETYSGRPDQPVHVHRRTAPVEVDGRLDETAWINADRVTGFIRRGGEAPAESQTFVRILYDDEHIYMGLEMEEPRISDFSINAAERDDGAIWRDDTVEVMIDPDGDGWSYFHFAINPAGVFRDSNRPIGMPPAGDVSFRSDAGVAATIDENGMWTVEIKVSAASLGAEIVPGGNWLMNVVRARKAGEGEVSSWFDGQVHETDSFRRVTFGRSILRNGNFTDLVPIKPSNRGAVGEKFINHWGVNAEECEVLEGRKNTVRIKNGPIYSYLRIPSEDAGTRRTLSGEVRARGEGTLGVRLSTAIIPPGSGLRFSHDIQNRFGPVELGSEPASHRFIYELEPHEVGYIYVSVRGESLIEHVSVVLD